MRAEERQLSLIAFLLGHRFGRTRQQIINAVEGYRSGDAGRKMLQRDVAFLAGMGVHVELRRIEGTSEDGNYEHVYVIQRQSVFAPPLHLEDDDLVVLQRLCDALRQRENFPLQEAARSAMAKLQACLKEGGVRSDTPRMAGSAFLEQIALAIRESRKLRLTHWSPWSGEKTSRVIHPHGLVSRGEYWYLAAWCELRRDVREFRLDRVDKLELLAGHFKPGKAGSLAELRFESRPTRGGKYHASLLFDATIAALAERRLARDSEREWRGEKLWARVHTDMPGTFCEMLLDWGSHVRVLELDTELRIELERRLQVALVQHEEGDHASCT